MAKQVLAPSPVAEAEAHAQSARLTYVSDTMRGHARRRSGKGFAFVRWDGRPLKDPRDLKRIRALVLPPAWKDVWICPDARGHIQATGIDARGRKQYRYHDRWREVRDATKYGRLAEFGKALPRIRARVERDLRRPGLPREKVIAAVVEIMGTTFIRIGNEEYARENQSFGLTTLRDRHADVGGRSVQFEFRGKSGKDHTIEVKDPRLAKIVQRCQELPGQELFQYVDPTGKVRDVKSEDVNSYIDEASGQDFSPKDFRTWGGTVLAAAALRDLGPPTSKTAAKRNVASAIKTVAARLGNTPAVCRKSYVHPGILNAYLEGRLTKLLGNGGRGRGSRGLNRDETAVLGLLAKFPSMES